MSTKSLPLTRQDAVYLTDGGRCLCGTHLGTSARLTGCDLSGQPILEVTPDVLAEAEAEGFTPKCEVCGKAPSRLHPAGSVVATPQGVVIASSRHIDISGGVR